MWSLVGMEEFPGPNPWWSVEFYLLGGYIDMLHL